LALAVPLSRFTPRVGGGSAFYVRRHSVESLYKFGRGGVYLVNKLIAMKLIQPLTEACSIASAILCLVTAGCANHPPGPPPTATTAAPENPTPGVVERFTLHSKVLKEARPCLVYLPPS
jgi:hypothetical protein